MYCPNCGFKLPDTMVVNPNELSQEKAKVAGGSGFDTAGPLMSRGGANVPPITTQPVKSQPGFFRVFFKSLLIMVLIIVPAGFILGTLLKKGGTGVVPIRNCVTSALGNTYSSCGDCPDSNSRCGGDGTCKSSLINGKEPRVWATRVYGNGAYDACTP